ncbi:putative Phosphatidylinositol 4-kinase beta [Blattamonas nauphoetae]|uniref:Phosphatidylinositol 4-kinase beta n=1 Tax=Blattamonas nauphoetae TaxID=2049346 RepID=A0ABQ9XGE9_9EUKA|nr:putative Phosphatidylinositol 4-kinase beta [Blattamonas nauphoetae]
MELFERDDRLAVSPHSALSFFDQAKNAVSVLADNTLHENISLPQLEMCSSTLLSLPTEVVAVFLPHLVKLSNTQLVPLIDQILIVLSQRSLLLALQIYLLLSCEEQEFSNKKSFQLTIDDPNATIIPINQRLSASPSPQGLFSPSLSGSPSQSTSNLVDLSIMYPYPERITENANTPSPTPQLVKIPEIATNSASIPIQSTLSDDKNVSPHIASTVQGVSFTPRFTIHTPPRHHAIEGPSSSPQSHLLPAFEGLLSDQPDTDSYFVRNENHPGAKLAMLRILLCSQLKLWTHSSEMVAKPRNMQLSPGTIYSASSPTPSFDTVQSATTANTLSHSGELMTRNRSLTSPAFMSPITLQPVSSISPSISTTSVTSQHHHSLQNQPHPNLLLSPSQVFLPSASPSHQTPSQPIKLSPVKQVSKASVMVELVEFAAVLGDRAGFCQLPSYLQARYHSFLRKSLQVSTEKRKQRKKNALKDSSSVSSLTALTESEISSPDMLNDSTSHSPHSDHSQPVTNTESPSISSSLVPPVSAFDPKGNENDAFGSNRCLQFGLSLFVYDSLKDVSRKTRLEARPKRYELCVGLMNELNREIAPGWIGDEEDAVKSAIKQAKRERIRRTQRKKEKEQKEQTEEEEEDVSKEEQNTPSNIEAIVPEQSSPSFLIPQVEEDSQHTPSGHSTPTTTPQMESVDQEEKEQMQEKTVVVEGPTPALTPTPSPHSSPSPSTHTSTQNLSLSPYPESISQTPTPSLKPKPSSSLQLGLNLKQSFILPTQDLSSPPRFFIRFVSPETRVLKSRERAPIMVWMETCSGEDWEEAMKLADRKRAEFANQDSEPQIHDLAEMQQSPTQFYTKQDPLTPTFFPAELLRKKEARISLTSIYSRLPSWGLSSFIVKEHDDIRQDALISFLLSLILSICQANGVGLWLRPCGVMPTSPMSGLVETLYDTVSIHEMKEGKKCGKMKDVVDEVLGGLEQRDEGEESKDPHFVALDEREEDVDPQIDPLSSSSIPPPSLTDTHPPPTPLQPDTPTIDQPIQTPETEKELRRRMKNEAKQQRKQTKAAEKLAKQRLSEEKTLQKQAEKQKRQEMKQAKADQKTADDERRKNWKTISEFIFEMYPNKPNGDESEEHKIAVRNFMESLAGYSIATYMLQLKDRHNANILISSTGHLMHIDFGFVLTRAPGGVSFEQSPFKLTKEYVSVLGGKNSPLYSEFRQLVIDGLMAIRANRDIFAQAILIQSRASGLPCFYKSGDVIVEQVNQRLFSSHSDQFARGQFEGLVNVAYNNTTTYAYDLFQWWQNKIRY